MNKNVRYFMFLAQIIAVIAHKIQEKKIYLFCMNIDKIVVQSAQIRAE